MPPISGWHRVAIIPTRITHGSLAEGPRWRRDSSSRASSRARLRRTRARSVRRVRSTRRPSETARRLDSPWMRALLDARDLGDGQPGAGEAAVDQRSRSRSRRPTASGAGRRHELVVGQVEQRDQVGPEGVVAVAEVGEPGPEREVHPGVQEPVAEPAHGGDVGAAAPGRNREPLAKSAPSTSASTKRGSPSGRRSRRRRTSRPRRRSPWRSRPRARCPCRGASG